MANSAGANRSRGRQRRTAPGGSGVPGTGSPTGQARGSATAGRELKSSKGLHLQLADSLRDRLRDNEWLPGDRLPTEAQLTAEYGVSRSTVRAALQLLETQGHTKTRHGKGTFVIPYGRDIKTGLQELVSMSETIRAHGLEPTMQFRSAVFRAATESEARDLECSESDQVCAVERAVLADGQLAAFSYDAMPASSLPEDFRPESLSGSLFHVLESNGVRATTAVADIHAVQDKTIGWGERPKASVYLLLDQVHYTQDGVPVLASKTYFLEGKFQFSVLRVR